MESETMEIPGRPSGLWTLEESAEYLGIQKRTLERMLRAGRLPFYKIIGKHRFCKREDLDAYIESVKMQAKLDERPLRNH